MSTTDRRPVDPPAFAWVACPDCDSDIHQSDPEPGHTLIEVRHAPTCPTWQGPTDYEAALWLRPPTEEQKKESKS